ncbi:MAG: carboxypeptidase-like regulatory domain-containing protein [Treponema sp.]|jgi:tetratricopeptide (TPR) repeat protein|nr:carboxypeptidase-like regulatory domain-containing protein [Treponema sp.]
MRSAKNSLKTVLFIFELGIFLVSCQTGRSIKRLSDESIMYGMIYDYESNPVSGVAVFLDDKKIADSDIQGRFILGDVKKGTYRIRLAKKGYEELEEQFDYVPFDVLYFKITNVAQLVNQAESLMDEKNFIIAGQIINRALAIEPDRQDILFLKSLNFYLQYRFNEARTILEEMMKAGFADDSIMQLLSLIVCEGYIPRTHSPVRALPPQ